MKENERDTPGKKKIPVTAVLGVSVENYVWLQQKISENHIKF